MTTTRADSPAAPLAAQIEGWSPEPVARVDELDCDAALSLHDLLALHGLPVADQAPHSDGTLQPLHHWVYFQSWPALSSLGADGHPRAGGLLPPLHDRRRMFAGGRCTFHAPLHFGEQATATSSLVKNTIKSGRSGELLFVTVQTTITQNQRLCITDEQDLVYRSGQQQPVAAAAPAAAPEPPQTEQPQAEPATGQRHVSFDPVTLFRFSTLTANSHRIHYDQAYAREVEGYASLLVHGPLLVLSMAEVLRGARPGELATLSYRLRQPVFSGESVDISLTATHGNAAAQATILDPAGGLRASAEAQFDHETAGRS